MDKIQQILGHTQQSAGTVYFDSLIADEIWVPGQAPGRDDKQRQKPPLVTLTLVSFAVSRKAYQKITERFAREYEAQTGQPIKFRLSFGGSGTQVHLAHLLTYPSDLNLNLHVLDYLLKQTLGLQHMQQIPTKGLAVKARRDAARGLGCQAAALCMATAAGGASEQCLASWTQGYAG